MRQGDSLAAPCQHGIADAICELGGCREATPFREAELRIQLAAADMANESSQIDTWRHALPAAELSSKLGQHDVAV